MMPTKVYLLIEWREGAVFEIIGVFSTQEKAGDAMQYDEGKSFTVEEVTIDQVRGK